MGTSSNENIFRVTGHLCREITGHRWIPHIKASEAEHLMFSLICTWINGWVNNREAGDFRWICAHYDVTVMRRKMISLVLSAIMLVVCSGAEDCSCRAACRYDGLEGISSTSHEYQIPTGDPWTCQAICSMNDNCDAVTSDETGSWCRFHPGVDGETCLVINVVPGMTLWVKNRGGRSCPSVRLLELILWQDALTTQLCQTFPKCNRAVLSRLIRNSEIMCVSFQLKWYFKTK